MAAGAGADCRSWPLQAERGGAGAGVTAALLLSVLLASSPALGRALAQGLQGLQGRQPAALLQRERTSHKTYSGLRADAQSLRQVYAHEQTIAVVELGPGRQLLNCELVEVLTPKLQQELLQNLSTVSKPIFISFMNMKIMMQKCKDFGPPGGVANRTLNSQNAFVRPWTVLTGIIPGTKWCGNGDLAMNYFDLGYLSEVDKCCRAHDICPVKVLGFHKRYNLTNQSFYTKSHCDCDSTFYQCLKSTQHATANLLGTVYFNILRVQCIEDVPSKENGRELKRIFQNPKRIY